MHDFSTVDGFVEITESLAEMIKYVANEPSVGLFYVQQHTQNAVPNLVSLKKSVAEKSRETVLHTEDSEDSITMVRSMKECGFPIADVMIKDIKASLAVMSTKQPQQGLIHSSSSSFLKSKTSSWGPTSWGRNATHIQQENFQTDSYFKNVLRSARQKASNMKWPQLDPIELLQAKGDKLQVDPSSNLSVTAIGVVSAHPDIEADELRLTSQMTDEVPEEDAVGGERPLDGDVPTRSLSSASENYDDFRATREAKLEEWLEDCLEPFLMETASSSEVKFCMIHPHGKEMAFLCWRSGLLNALFLLKKVLSSSAKF
ncbi:BLOC-1-related complex subunit 8 [Dillenia turbinata]|uniref:BLOC-1-related complex subunit 8 n=1 Tax=Dillenia turbinata TaxID=194707 RepID=A0AAN8ZCS5_9MAGN